MILNFCFENHQKIQKKIVHITNVSCCKYEKISIKNTLYFQRSKKDKFTKISDHLIRGGDGERPADATSSYRGRSLNPHPTRAGRVRIDRWIFFYQSLAAEVTWCFSSSLCLISVLI
jgi:hypothetical protein